MPLARKAYVHLPGAFSEPHGHFPFQSPFCSWTGPCGSYSCKRPSAIPTMDCNLLGSSVHGISQARILEWVAIFSSRGSSWPMSLASPALAGGFFTTSSTWEARYSHQGTSKTSKVCYSWVLVLYTAYSMGTQPGHGGERERECSHAGLGFHFYWG